MSDQPIISFAGDGVIPAGSPKITFLEIPGRPFVTEGFSADAPTNASDRVDALGHFAGGLLTLGKRTGSCSLDINSLHEQLPIRGCTFVYSWEGVAHGWVVTQVGLPQDKEGDIKLPLSFQELSSPLAMVPHGDYFFVVDTAIDPLSFAVNGRHTVEPSGWSLETDIIENFRPLVEDREEVDCDAELPAGLTITTGQLTGTPTVEGVSRLRMKCISTRGKIGWIEVKITITPAP